MSQPAIPSSEPVGFTDDATEPALPAAGAISGAASVRATSGVGARGEATSQATSQAISQATSHPTSQATNQTTTHPTSQATSHPTSHPTSRATSQAPAQAAASDQLQDTPLGRARRRFVSAISSYRLRVLIWFIALLGLGTLATVMVMAEVLLQRTDERVRADLRQEGLEFSRLAGGIDPATAAPFGTDVERIFDVFLSRSIPSRNEVFVTFLDGEVYRRTARPPLGSDYAIELDPEYLARVATVQESVTDRLSSPAGAVDYQAIPVRVDGQTRGVFTVAIFRDLERSDQEEVFRAALSVGVVLLLIGSLLAWRLADRVLAPVRQTAATARSISETDLSRRVAVRGDDEVAELARTFNEMLDRVGSAFEAQRRFMDDVGHELRTPLTIVQGHLELLDEGPPVERERAVELVLEEVDRMTGLVSDLMLLAASAQPDFIKRERVDVAELARSVLDKARVLGDRGWQLDLVRPGTISADRQRLTQAMLQLVANAVRKTGPGDAIHIGADVHDSVARLWVSDTGPGIPESAQDKLFQRFYRGEGESRSSGSGLGLSIVRAIAEAHGGTADVASRPGRGATFTLVVPVDEPRPAPGAVPRRRSWFRR